MTNSHDRELRDALRALAAEWDPPESADSEPSCEDDECSCGGEDDWGRPVCSHNDACRCEGCTHWEHSERRYCSVSGCEARSEFEVRAWTMSHRLVEAWELDPAQSRETGYELVELDDTTRTCWSRTVCSYLHAKQIIDADREPRAGWTGGDRELRYEIVRFKYEPDHLDLPEILYELRENAHLLEFNARELALAGCEHTEPDAMSPDFGLEATRRVAVRVVAALAALSTSTPEPRRFVAGDEMPDDLRGVLVEGEPYSRRRVRREVMWEGPTERLTWHELTALDGVIEYPHARLAIEQGAGEGAR